MEAEITALNMEFCYIRIFKQAETPYSVIILDNQSAMDEEGS